ncbi:MAG: hypothetical protein IGQ45_06050 [Cyanobacterium sp. T60_A2020_053]|nr:hypothetical protein [Cyanobacterium sp. T60_A2020_053]
MAEEAKEAWEKEEIFSILLCQVRFITYKLIKMILVQFIERDTISRVIHYTVGKVRS